MTKSKPTPTAGRIIAHHGVRVRIDTAVGVIEFKPPRRSAWVVGDEVVFVKGRPTEVKLRRTELARIASSGTRQVLAANIDQLLIVTACGENFKLGLVDRFMVAATHAGIAPALVLNKTDLDPSGELIKAASIYADYGYPFVAVSAETGEGIDALRTICAGKINSLVGHSGVGKTSLLKVLIPGTDRPVAAIHAATNQGRHTTTAAELFPLPHGGDLIDSPGIRQFMPSGLTPPEVAHHFPGFEPFMGQCKFRDCLHLTEPGCGIREGLEAGQIDADRYASYQRILASVQVDDKPEWMKKGS